MRALLFLVLALAADLAQAQGAALPGAVTTVASGARISGANGIHFGPDGLLYVTSVVGSELLALDPETGAVRSVPPSSSTASEPQPPSFIFNGIAGGAPDNLYLASERDRSLIRIDLPKGFTPAK